MDFLDLLVSTFLGFLILFLIGMGIYTIIHPNIPLLIKLVLSAACFIFSVLFSIGIYKIINNEY